MSPRAQADAYQPETSPASGAIVIVGSGLAGYGVAKELRALSPDQPVTLLTRDDGAFSSKPMLSNALAQQKTPESLTQNTPAGMAEKLRIEVKHHVAAQRIDRDRRVVVTDAGDVPYDQLVLAVGADQITLPITGDGASSIHQVNDLTT